MAGTYANTHLEKWQKEVLLTQPSREDEIPGFKTDHVGRQHPIRMRPSAIRIDFNTKESGQVTWDSGLTVSSNGKSPELLFTIRMRINSPMWV